jgi:hypothetical protein
MYRQGPWRIRQMIYLSGRAYYIFDFKRGDVNGDGFAENILLVGDKPSGEDSPYVSNITLIIAEGGSDKHTIVPLKENSGYNPTLFLGDFTGDKIKDIVISIDSGGSGATTFDYIYSFADNKLKLIFDFEKFNDEYVYQVNYRDNYQAEVISVNMKKRYIIDLRYKGREYLSEIYDGDGKLKQPIEGFVNPISGFYPIDYQRDGIYEILIWQKIAGRYNADALGYVQNSLSWNGREFINFMQDVAINGEDLGTEV